MMKKFNSDHKMQVCFYCPQYREDMEFMGAAGHFCKAHNNFINEIEFCSAWEDFWVEEKEKGSEEVKKC